MALFDRTIQTGDQAQQLGFAPPTTPANSFTAPSLPLGYGQMQGQPLLSRNPNYGVPSGIASLLGGANPMGAPQAGALLTPQQAVPSQMAGINPLTGQAFQTFDATETANIFTQGRTAQEEAAAAAQAEMLRQAQEQAAAEAAATEAAAQAERDRIAAEQAAAAQAEADRIAAEQAAAAQAEADRIAAEQAAADAAAAEAAEAAAAEEAARAAEAQRVLDEMAAAQETQTTSSIQTDTFSPRDRFATSPLRPGSFDPESGFFLPTIPVVEPVAAPAPASAPVPVASIPAIDSPIMQMGGFNPEANMAGMFDRVMLPPPPPPTASVTPTLEPETSLGDRLRGMGGIFANAIAPGDVGYEALAAAAEPTGPRGFVASQRDFDGRYPFSSAQQPAAQESIQRPAPTPRPVPMPVGIDALLGGGRGDPVNIPMPAPMPAPPVVATPAPRQPLPLPPATTPAEARAAATPKPFVAPDLSALLPVKPRTQKVTKPKRGRKKVVEPDQRSSRKKRKRRQRGPR